MNAVENYKALSRESQYNRVVSSALVMAADAAIAELEKELLDLRILRDNDLLRFEKSLGKKAE